MQPYEGQTPEAILGRVLGRMDTVLQIREGSYAYEQSAPMALELSKAYLSLGELVDAFYVSANSGAYLDLHAHMLALSRRSGLFAQAQVTFTGRDGVTIPAGTAFFTTDGLEFALTQDVTLQNGCGEGTIQAAHTGARYNVAAGEISQMLRNVSGLDSFFVQAAAGGADAESDDELYARIEARRRAPAASGSESDYLQWALSCEGVGAAEVQRQWNGQGTVRVLIAGYDRRPVDDEVTGACVEYIQSRRPVGAEVTVASVSGIPIHVAAQIEVEPSAAPDTVQAAFAQVLDGYLRELAFTKYIVYYNRIAALLMTVDGITDYSGLTVNGGTDNIDVDADAVPVLGEVALTWAS